MTKDITLRERQAPLKTRYTEDPSSARMAFTVKSETPGNDPTKVRIGTEAAGGVSWDVGAHPMAGGVGDLPCSGDLLLASLAACQEITLRMVASAMGIELEKVEITVEGEMDFRGTMGVDPVAPVGFDRIRSTIAITADAPEERLQRLAQRVERYCVVAATLTHPPVLETTLVTHHPNEPEGGPAAT